MPAVTWTQAMSVGIEALDTDHKMLFGLINQLDTAIAKGESEAIIASVINVLVDYTEYHFGREEAMMAAVDYAGFDAHRTGHRALVEALNHLRAAYTGGFRQGIETSLLEFMRDWIIGHIQGEDLKYAPFMKGCETDLARVDENYTRKISRSA
jgi:hemerythrin-like metal-binding protein